MQNKKSDHLNTERATGKVAVIGAGITGLSAAYQLEKNGVHVEVFDKNSSPGGVIKTQRVQEWQYEFGPNTLLLKDREVENLIRETGLFEEMIEANPRASRRYIVKNGELVPLPGTLGGFLKTPLFSGSAKLRLLREPFVGKTREQVTVAEFFRKRFGKEVLDYAVNPFIAGIHAGTPNKLSMKHAFSSLHQMEQESGSVVWGGLKKVRSGKKNGQVRRRLISFPKGLQQFPIYIFNELQNSRMSQQVMRVESADGKGWRLYTQDNQFGPFDHVICTIPIHKLSDSLLPGLNSRGEVFRDVYYPPLSSVILGFKKDDVAHPLDGFGFLVPEAERRSVLGALFSSTLFPARAPENHHLLTTFVGGARQPEFAGLDTGEILELVMKDLRDLLGVRGEPVFKDHIYWPDAIPQYNVGYQDVLDSITAFENAHPGLHLAGNFKGGISLPDCIKNGLNLAGRITGLSESSYG